MAAAGNRPEVSRETRTADDPPTFGEILDEHRRLQDEVRVLIDLVEYQVGRKWMELDLKLQVEKVEIMLRTGFD